MAKAHLVQLDIRWEDPALNHEAALTMLDRAHVAPGDLILFPEMFATGFSFNIESTNDKQGATLAMMAELADDTEALVQGGRTVAACHRCAASNVMSVLAPGQKLVAEYAKIHPFTAGGEHERFAPGSEVLVYDWAATGLKVMPAICYDLRFPELFRFGLRRGAEVFALGACWPSVRQAHWRALSIARAIENQAFMLACNRVGKDPDREGKPGLTYAGGSMVISPTGEILGELDDRPGVLSVEIDPEVVRSWRAKFPAWRDMKLI